MFKQVARMKLSKINEAMETITPDRIRAASPKVNKYANLGEINGLTSDGNFFRS